MATPKKKTVSKKGAKSPKKAQTIYVQIASYRDPELLNTLNDCIKNAKNPENLRFGIAWQHAKEDKWDKLTKYKNDKRFTILDIDHREAKGVCHARKLLNEQYNGETYTLQLDSHHRFVKDWDVQLIDMLEGLRKKGHKKPLLTSYIPDFFPETYSIETRNTIPWKMNFERFFPEGVVFVRPGSIDDYKERTEPVPSRFLSAHFIFVDGKFCKEVPYDETYYFHGEEPDLAIRSFMAGYDLFHPHRVIVWHEYTRNGKKKHWDDHTDWAELNNISYKHYRDNFENGEKKMLLNVKPVRTLKEYELYAGFDFATRRVHRNTIDNKYPPSSLDEKSHEEGLAHYQKICLDVVKDQVQESDYDVWAVVILDKDGNEIYRQDASPDEIKNSMSENSSNPFMHLWRTFYSEKLAVGWVVWPHSVSKGWMNRIEYKFPVE